MELTKVKKRNQAVVDFDRVRIEKAIEKACAETGVAVGTAFYASVTDDITTHLDQKFFEEIPCAEDIQAVVEMTLAERGLFEVANAYVHYRDKNADIGDRKPDQLLQEVERR